MTTSTISLAHGSGGRAMQQLIDEILLPAFDNDTLSQREDQARLALAYLSADGDRLALTTDSYVIDPIYFPGGDIGKLAICGTLNDLTVGGATPHYLTCGLILEEGLPLTELQQIVNSMAQTAKQAGVKIVTGDTKVVPHGAADKIFINTTGVGVIPHSVQWAMNQIKAGDKIIVSGTLGDHGATILNLREQLGLQGSLQSDCAVLFPLVAPLRSNAGIRTMRDATRGGVNAILHEYHCATGLGMLIHEAMLPLHPSVRGMCELLGLDPLNLANEGKVVIVVAKEHAKTALSQLQQHPLGKHAAIIGEVINESGVWLKGVYGTVQSLELPTFEPLPRIC